jgi:gluconolactonase
LNKLSTRFRITGVIRNLIVCAIAGGLTIPLVLGQPAAVGGVRRIDPALDNLISPAARVEKVAGNFGFTEGPLWVRRDGSLLFSDVPNNAIMQWTQDGNVSVFRKPVFPGPFPEGAQVGSNGLTLDPEGLLIAAEHGNRRVTRTALVRNREPVYDGPVTVLADRYEGKRLNSPNDVISKRNGDIYFTDPPGLYRGYPQGAANPPKQELDFNGVYRITAAGKLELLASDLTFPNGLAFSPDEKKLYVSNSFPEKKWMVYDVKPDGGVANGKVFLDMTKEPGAGVPDGMKIDEEGNIYATGPGGILVISPQGKHLGTIQLPEVPSNCAFGDADGQTLFITARTSVYRIRLKVPGRLP